MKKIYQLLLLFSLTSILTLGTNNLINAQENVDPEDNPCDAPPQCGFQAIDAYELRMEGGPGCDWPNEPNCALHDPNWFAFVAGGNQVTLTIEIFGCSSGEGVQFSAYTGTPDCTGACYENLEGPLAGDCTVPLTPGTYTYTFNTTPGFTYYLVFDGWNGDLCDLGIEIDDGGQPPSVDDTVMPQEIQLPEFEGPDTICVGADQQQFCADNLPPGAAYTLWILPNGDTVQSDVGNPCITLEDIFESEGTFELQVAAGNDCDTSLFNSGEYIIAPIEPDTTKDEICEGEEYNWQYGDVDAENLEPGEHIFSEFVNTATSSCMQEQVLVLNIKNENEDDPTVIDTTICVGDEFFFDVNPGTPENVTLTNATAEYEYEDISPVSGCDTFFEINLDVVGGDFEILEPACDYAGNVVFDYMFTNLFGSLDLDDPSIEVTIEWYNASTNQLIFTGEQLLLNQDQLEQYGQFDLELRVNISYGPNLEYSCQFISDPYPVNPDNWIPEILSVDGPGVLCPGTSGEYTLDIEFMNFQPGDFIVDTTVYLPNDITYETIPGGVRLTAGPNADNGPACFEVLTTCGFTDSLCINIDISDVQQPDVGADREECNSTFSLEADPGSDGMWSVSSSPMGSTTTFDDTASPSTDATVDAFGAYTFVWTEGVPGCQKSDSLTITYVEGPSLDGTPMYDCNAAQTEYTVTFSVTGGTPPYQVTSGNGSMDGSGTFTSNPFASESTHTITIVDDLGCGPVEVEVSYTCNCDNEAGTMEQTPIELCADGTAQGTYNGDATLDGDDTEGYLLHSGSGNVMGTVYAMNMTGEFTFQPGMIYGTTYYISHIVGNDVGGVVDTTDACLQVAAGQPVVWYDYPTADAGPDTTACGLTYQLQGSPSPGSWEVLSGPGNATLTDSSIANTTLTVDMPGTYTLEWLADNQGCLDSAEVDITLVGEPMEASYTVECTPDKTEYRVIVEVTGGSGTYNLTSNNGTLMGSTVTSDWMPISTQDDTLVIFDDVGCGPLEIPIQGTCDCESAVGTLDTMGTLTACETGGCVQAVYDNTGEVLDMNDIGLYILHTDTVGSGFGQVLASNSDGEFCYTANLTPGTEYYISYLVGNEVSSDSVDLDDQCLAASDPQTVVFAAQPDAQVMNDTTSCTSTFALMATPSVGDGTWSVVSSPMGSGTVDIADASAAQTTATTDGTPGMYRFQWSETNGDCSANATVSVELYDAPVVDPASITYTCNSDGETYTVSFTIEDGQMSSYVVDGDAGSLSGSTFTSDPVQKDSMYQFFISDGNACDTVNLTDSRSCPCITDAGQISVNDADLCEDETLEVTYDGSMGSQDDQDAVEYILKDGTGSILQRNMTGSFTFDDGTMSLGTEYTVRAYVGDPNGSGTGVVLTEECIDSTAGVPVQWFAYPEVMIDPSATTITCVVKEITLDASMSTPQGAVEFMWEAVDTGSIKAGEETSPRPIVTAGGTYQVTVTHTESGCSSVGSVQITQSEDVPTIVLEEYEKLTCARTSVTVDASNSTQSSSIIPTWRNPAGTVIDTISGYQMTATTPGVYTFTLRDTMNDCDITKDVPIEEDVQAPTAVASVDALLDCNTEEVTVSGEGSSSGAAFTYTWTTSDGNIVGSATSLNITANATGTYILEVTDTDNGCTSTATVVVEENPAALSAVSVQTDGLNCKGGERGTIRANALNGTAPYTYTLSPGGTNSAGVFTELDPGVYELNVVDANGCAVDTTITMEEPQDFDAAFIDAVRIEEGDSAIIHFAAVSDSLAEVRWEVDGEYTCVSTGAVCDSIQVKDVESQVIVATLVSDRGCVIERSIQLFVVENRDVYIPNAFSPNNDGVNDVWEIGAGPKVVGVEDVEVFDRWGERVYQLDAAEVDETLELWDGRYNNEPLGPAVFMYSMNVVYDDGEKIRFKGDVTLLK